MRAEDVEIYYDPADLISKLLKGELISQEESAAAGVNFRRRRGYHVQRHPSGASTVSSHPAGSTAATTPDRQYEIHEVAQLTGLEPARLRAWERRYDVVRPVRQANGYRAYSAEQVALL
mgnify:CR=1 FL=1